MTEPRGRRRRAAVLWGIALLGAGAACACSGDGEIDLLPEEAVVPAGPSARPACPSAHPAPAMPPPSPGMPAKPMPPVDASCDGGPCPPVMPMCVIDAGAGPKADADEGADAAAVTPPMMRPPAGTN